MAGWKFRYFRDIVNPAELPATVAAYKSQQFRWCKGSIQTALKLIPRILRADFNRKIKAEAFVHLLSYSVHPLMVLNILFTLPLLLLESWSSYGLHSFSLYVLLGAAALLSVGTFGPVCFYIYSQRELYGDWKRRILWLPVLIMVGTGVAVGNMRAFLEAVFGVSSPFVRTPKYRIESKHDRISTRRKYRQRLDKLVVLEALMGVYCVLCIAASVSSERLFVIPFMLLYAAGFFYISGMSLKESFQKPA